jgi:c-di-GMP-binding flagellar brake protein YcgR
MPKELLRLQRRESYRLATSVVNPVKCLINAGGHFLETVVIDISIGGIGILSYEGISLLKAGETYHGCRVEMPGAGTFAVSLNVCTIFDVALKNGRVTHRAGCRFIDLPPSVETEIQRYINRLERQRLSRYI